MTDKRKERNASLAKFAVEESEKSVQTLRNTIKILNETQETAANTLQDLNSQSESLNRIERTLDDTEDNASRSAWMLRGMTGVFGRMKNFFKYPLESSGKGTGGEKVSTFFEAAHINTGRKKSQQPSMGASPLPPAMRPEGGKGPASFSTTSANACTPENITRLVRDTPVKCQCCDAEGVKMDSCSCSCSCSSPSSSVSTSTSATSSPGASSSSIFSRKRMCAGIPFLAAKAPAKQPTATCSCSCAITVTNQSGSFSHSPGHSTSSSAYRSHHISSSSTSSSPGSARHNYSSAPTSSSFAHHVSSTLNASAPASAAKMSVISAVDRRRPDELYDDHTAQALRKIHSNDKIVDQQLDEILGALGNLHSMAATMNDTLSQQAEQLSNIDGKVDRVNERLAHNVQVAKKIMR
eukprot:GILI01018345.1.p1 GENE.GILI01018345.1~~GILI01018345.1.p1  ORF type:complete len:409 (-),score=85.46 GILI01018345.1:1535-2761(-)